MNNLTCTGNLGSDARDMTSISSGQKCLLCSVGVYIDAETTQWTSVFVYCSEKRYNYLKSLLVKGARVVVTGRMRLDEYKNRNGETKVQPSVTADHIEVLK